MTAGGGRVAVLVADHCRQMESLIEIGSIAPGVTPLARIPANGAEMNQWQAKQVLDRGVYGVITPHVSGASLLC